MNAWCFDGVVADLLEVFLPAGRRIAENLERRPLPRGTVLVEEQCYRLWKISARFWVGEEDRPRRGGGVVRIPLSREVELLVFDAAALAEEDRAGQFQLHAGWTCPHLNEERRELGPEELLGMLCSDPVSGVVTVYQHNERVKVTTSAASLRAKLGENWLWEKPFDTIEAYAAVQKEANDFAELTRTGSVVE